VAVCRRKEVDFSVVHSGCLSEAALKKAVQAELSFRAKDDSVVQAENGRNDYETYIFALRSKLKSGDPVMEFASPELQESLGQEVDEAEAWIYEHSEEEASVYTKRLDELKKKEDQLLRRKEAFEAVPEKVRLLKASIKKFKASAISPAYDHISKEKLDGVVADCDAASEWLSELEPVFAEQKKWEDPVLSLAELSVRSTSLMSSCSRILSEPRPKPPEPEKKEKREKKDKKGKGDKGNDEGSAEKGEGEEAASEKKEGPERPRKPPVWKRMLPFTAIVPVVAALLVAGGYGETYVAPLWALLGRGGGAVTEAPAADV